MDTKNLASAVRAMAKDVDEISEDAAELDRDTLNDVRGLLKVLAHIVDGMPIDRAFGSPGDWGYNTAIGKALAVIGSQPPNLSGIMQNDIMSALDDCVELGMTAEQAREVIGAIITKALSA